MKQQKLRFAPQPSGSGPKVKPRATNNDGNNEKVKLKDQTLSFQIKDQIPSKGKGKAKEVDNVIVLSDDDDDLDSGSLKNEPPRDLIKNTKKQKKVATAPQDDDLAMWDQQIGTSEQGNAFLSTLRPGNAFCSSSSDAQLAPPPVPRADSRKRAPPPDDSDTDGDELIHPDSLGRSVPTAAVARSTPLVEGGHSDSKRLYPLFTGAKASSHKSTPTTQPPKQKQSTSAPASLPLAKESAAPKVSLKGKEKAPEPAPVDCQPASSEASVPELEIEGKLKLFFESHKLCVEEKTAKFIVKMKKVHADIDEMWRKKAGNAKKIKRNKHADRVLKARATLRRDQARTFDVGRREVYHMMTQNLELCERSLTEISPDDPLVKIFEEILVLCRHKNFLGKTQLGLLWYLEVFDLRLVAGFAKSLLSSPSECTLLLDQLRRGDPEWQTTLESLPEIAPEDPNLLVYLLSSKPCDVDGPLPLAGSSTAKKVGFSVDPSKHQLYGGSAFSGAGAINAALQAKGTTEMGKILSKVEGGETAKTGGGKRVHGEHLSQASRLQVKFSQNRKPFVASSDSYKARYGVPDDSPDAFSTAIENNSKTIEPNPAPTIPSPSSSIPRAFAYADNAPSIPATGMEAVLIVGARLAASSSLFAQAAQDVGLDLPADGPFEVRNKELGVEDRTSSWSDSEAQRARGRASLMKQWTNDRPRMMERCVKGGRSGGFVTGQVTADKNAAAWIKGHKSYLHWSGRGWGQRKPALAARAVVGVRVVALATANSKLERVLHPYPKSIPDSRADRNRTPAEEVRAKALIDDHVASWNKFVPLFPANRDSVTAEEYDYRFEFEFRGHQKTYQLNFTRADLERKSKKALKWFTGKGCEELHSLATNLNARLRKAEKEGMSRVLDKYMEGVEIVYNPEEGDDVDDDEEEEEEEEEAGEEEEEAVEKEAEDDYDYDCDYDYDDNDDEAEEEEADAKEEEDAKKGEGNGVAVDEEEEEEDELDED